MKTAVLVGDIFDQKATLSYRNTGQNVLLLFANPMFLLFFLFTHARDRGEVASTATRPFLVLVGGNMTQNWRR